jgi:hypothetical protein
VAQDGAKGPYIFITEDLVADAPAVGLTEFAALDPGGALLGCMPCLHTWHLQPARALRCLCQQGAIDATGCGLLARCGRACSAATSAQAAAEDPGMSCHMPESEPAYTSSHLSCRYPTIEQL